MTSATPEPRAGEHTKGPWVARSLPPFGQWQVFSPAHPQEIIGSTSWANARRIVACVNALEGVSLEAIENGGRSGSVMQALGIERDRAKVLLEATQRQYVETKDDRDNLLAERDLLRERELELVGALEWFVTGKGKPDLDGSIARALLAKHGR